MRVTRVLSPIAAAATLAAVAACHAEARPRPARAAPSGLAQQGPAARMGGPGVRPGIDAAALIGEAANPYTGNAGAIRQGRQLFTGFNCSGCHSGYGGGGMGPNLRDSAWIYGASDADLYATIASGRPNGMPAWGGRLPETQIWQIIAYLRTLGTPAEPERPPTPTRTTASHNPVKPAG